MNPLSAIPLPYRLLALALFAGALVAFGWAKGAGHVQAEWDLAVAEQSSATEIIKTKQAEVTTNTITQYVDRIKIVRTAGETIIKEIPRYVPSNACTLPGGFRLLHDAAATGHDPDTTGIADAQPVDAQDLGLTLSDNYTAFRLNAEQLIALQGWVLKQSQIRGE